MRTWVSPLACLGKRGVGCGVARRSAKLIPLMLVAVLVGCARTAPQPIMELSDASSRIGEHDAAEDLRLCRASVREAAPVSMQPRWLPPLGMPENGVVLGTVDAPHPVWPSQAAYRREIERCLTARGYKIHGWQ